MDADCCRLCGDVIDANGGDGLCSECYFSNADVEWLAEHYPHLLADDADDSADDPKPRRNPHSQRSHHHAQRPKSTYHAATMVGPHRDQSAHDARGDGRDVGQPHSAICHAIGGMAGQ